MKSPGRFVRVRRYCFLYLLLLAGWPSLARADSATPVYDEFTRHDIGADGTAWTTVQLPDGRLLFGLDAVVEFDGSRWRSHPVPNAVAVRALAPAPDGRIWLGAMGEVGYLSPNAQGFSYQSLTAQLPADVRAGLGEVWQVLADGAGAVFVAKEYVLRWSGETFRWWHLPGGRRLAGFTFENRIHLAHYPSGLLVLTTEGPQTLLAPEVFPGAAVMWMGRLQGRRTLVTTRGLLQEQEGRFQPFVPELDSWIRSNVLTSAVALQTGGLAIGTLHGGVTTLEADGRGLRRFGLSAGLTTDTVYSLFEDREGFIWITSPTRLLRFLPDPSLILFPVARAEPLHPLALGVQGDGVVVGTEHGLLRLAPGEEPHLPRLEAVEESRRYIYALRPHDGGLAVALRSGIALLPSEGRPYPLHHSGIDTQALATDPADQSLVAAEGRSLVRIGADGEVVPVGHLPDLPTSLAVVAGDVVVAGTGSRGLMATPSHAVPPGLVNALAGETGSSLVDRMAAVVVAGRGRVIAAYDPATGQTHAQQLPDGFRITALHSSAAETWLGGERTFGPGLRLPALYRVRYENESLEYEPWAEPALARIGSVSALLHVDRDGGGQLWIGGTNGLIRLELGLRRPIRRPLPPVLRVATDVPSGAGTLLLPYRNNRLEVEIAWPEPGRSSALLLQTRMEGSATDWDLPQERGAVRLGNLQHGQYELQARFITATGQTSEISRFRFRVAPPWWLTPWALVLGFAGLGGVVFGAVRLRVRGLRRRAERLERLVQERTAELTHANRAKTDFVAKMSHELRNPLNGIVASAHALEESALPPEQQDLVSTMRHCAELLDALIGDVLDFSEIEAGRVTLQRAPYDPVELAARVVTMVEPVAARKGLQVLLVTAPDAPRLTCGDASRVQQVILNLVSNAVKFSDRGTVSVHVTAGLPPARAIRITVSDEGPGIPDAEAGRLFEKFARLTDARTRNVPGTGLGLAVCRQLVEQMGGRIWVERSRRRGAAFSFELPVDSTDATRPAPAPPAPAALPRTALVVEDIGYNAQAMVAMLAPMGCQARLAPTAAQALALLREQPFEVVFIDFDLPDMSGPDLARAILAHPRDGCGPPLLIATTAYADDATRTACLRAGMHAYLSKPVSPQKIRAVLSKPDLTTLAAASIDLPEPPPPAVNDLDLSLLDLLAPKGPARQAQADRLRALLQADLDQLTSGAARRDFAALHSHAHRILGHAGFVGATRLAAVAGEVQRAAREEPAAALELLPALTAEALRLAARLADLGPSPGTGLTDTPAAPRSAAEAG